MPTRSTLTLYLFSKCKKKTVPRDTVCFTAWDLNVKCYFQKHFNQYEVKQPHSINLTDPHWHKVESQK